MRAFFTREICLEQQSQDEEDSRLIKLKGLQLDSHADPFTDIVTAFLLYLSNFSNKQSFNNSGKYTDDSTFCRLAHEFTLINP